MDTSLSQMLTELVNASNENRYGAEQLGASLIPMLPIKRGDVVRISEGRAFRADSIKFEFFAYGNMNTPGAGFSIVGPIVLGSAVGTTRHRIVLNLKGERVS